MDVVSLFFSLSLNWHAAKHSKLLQVKKHFNLVVCKNDYECSGGQFCMDSLLTGGKLCQCTSDRWWNSSSLYCRKLSTIYFLDGHFMSILSWRNKIQLRWVLHACISMCRQCQHDLLEFSMHLFAFEHKLLEWYFLWGDKDISRNVCHRWSVQIGSKLALQFYRSKSI